MKLKGQAARLKGGRDWVSGKGSPAFSKKRHDASRRGREVNASIGHVLRCRAPSVAKLFVSHVLAKRRLSARYITSLLARTMGTAK